MTRLTVLAAIALSAIPVAANAASGQSICINPKYSYEAHAMDSHTVAVKNTIGRHQDWAQLATSCFNLREAYSISLASTFTCIGQGDSVVSRRIDGQTQSCRVTGVAPLTAYTPDAHG
jgi:hypothetical protein